jgi:polar amino acid transport system permease protein
MTTLETIINSMPLLLIGAVTTLKVTVVSSIIGFSIGILFGCLNSEKIKTYGFQNFINFYILIVRGTPVSVQVLIFYYMIPDIIGINFSAFAAGSIALGINSIAYVSEIVRGGINAIPNGQWEAGYTLGYSKTEKLLYIILPQMFKNCTPSFTNEFISLIKETSIISIIGLTELTRVGMNINARTLQPIPIYLSMAILYFTMTTTASLIANKLESNGRQKW